ncbi:hypothetical protein L596_008087 [Steinernema carpocapsae]|uniref:Rho-GAP domain-containing protein n=1 Tax=Steinernema carpocapsae TaxID=34508 RepID=A0A4U5PCE7_STECR|nr:hypothetical protein L596_008087 [Steinernema carpocapsae]
MMKDELDDAASSSSTQIRVECEEESGEAYEPAMGWVEIEEPRTKERMFANLQTGECAWEVPPGVAVKRMKENQWWELFDSKSKRFYYYNATTLTTVWQKPNNCDIIPLAKLQLLKENTEIEFYSQSRASKVSSETQTSPSRLRRRLEDLQLSDSRPSVSVDALDDDAVYAQEIGPESGVITKKQHLYSHSNPSTLPSSNIYSNFDLSSELSSSPVPSMGTVKSSLPVCFPSPSSSHTMPSARGRSTSSSSEQRQFPTMSRPEHDTHNTSFQSGTGNGDVPVDSWTKDSIKHPLSKGLDKNVKKDALSLFKLVQSYMGDRKSKTSADKIAVSIVEQVQQKPDLIDELFLQLVKQLTDNERSDSLRRGWELLAITLSFVTPKSEESRSSLTSFVEMHSDSLLDSPEVAVSKFAQQCLKRLLRAPTIGVRPKPSTELVQESRIHIFSPPQFSATLDELMDLQADRCPERQIPWIESTLIDLIIASGGPQTEGLFRVPADPEQLQTARLRLDRWLLPVVRDAHVPAALLKLWLRQLPTPLIPDSIYDRCLAICDQPEECLKTVELLPTTHRLVLGKLVWLLRVLGKAENVLHTKMDASNLAMVMAPNILRCRSEDPRVIFENTRREMLFLRTLLNNLSCEHLESLV